MQLCELISPTDAAKLSQLKLGYLKQLRCQGLVKAEGYPLAHDLAAVVYFRIIYLLKKCYSWEQKKIQELCLPYAHYGQDLLQKSYGMIKKEVFLELVDDLPDGIEAKLKNRYLYHEFQIENATGAQVETTDLCYLNLQAIRAELIAQAREKQLEAIADSLLQLK